METMYRVTIYGFTWEVWNQTQFTADELVALPFEEELDYGSASIGDYGTFHDENEARTVYESAKADVWRVSCEQTHINGLYSVSFDILQLEKFTVDEDDEKDNFEVIEEYAEGNA